jgi:hypothetical protein
MSIDWLRPVEDVDGNPAQLISTTFQHRSNEHGMLFVVQVDFRSPDHSAVFVVDHPGRIAVGDDGQLIAPEHRGTPEIRNIKHEEKPMTQTAPQIGKEFISTREPKDCRLLVDVTRDVTQFTILHKEGWTRACAISSQDAKDLALSILQVLGEAPPEPPTSVNLNCISVSTTYSVEWNVGRLVHGRGVETSQEALKLAISLYEGEAKNIRMLMHEKAVFLDTTTFDFVPPADPHWNARSKHS